MRGIHKLLTWIAILIVTCSIPIFGVRIIRPMPATTACIQLLAPTTGEVLTVDATTSAAYLDARRNFPIPLPTTAPTFRAPLSPDQTHVIDAFDLPLAGNLPAYQLWLGKRSTAYRRPLTPNSPAEGHLWSPDSRHIAFTEMRGWGANSALVNLAITAVDSRVIQREPIPEILDDGWFNRSRQVVWSPDSTLLAVSMFYPALVSTATVALRPVDADHSIYVSLPAVQIEYIKWSPDSQIVLVFAQEVVPSSPHHVVYALSRDGRILSQTTLSPDSTPLFTSESGIDGVSWSPDSHYFYVLGIAPFMSLLDVYDRNGNRSLAAPLTIIQLPHMWSTLPHTLIYFTYNDDHQELHALDAETGISTMLQDDIPLEYTVWLAPNASNVAVISTDAPSQFTPHLLSLDLRRNTTPFGTFKSSNVVYPEWLPDSQKLLLTSEQETTFTVHVLLMNSGEVQEFRITKQNAVDEPPWASWLTNDIILISQRTKERRTLSRLDTRSGTVLPLFSLSSNADYAITWHDDAYLAATTYEVMTLYRLRDGEALFTTPPPIGGAVTAYVEPQERALLLFHERDDTNVGYPTLDLITGTSTLKLSSRFDLTYPAWSPDGEMFAVGAFDNNGTGWRLKVMSRDGALLKDFSVQTANRNPNYDQVRWTTCD